MGGGCLSKGRAIPASQLFLSENLPPPSVVSTASFHVQTQLCGYVPSPGCLNNSFHTYCLKPPFSLNPLNSIGNPSYLRTFFAPHGPLPRGNDSPPSGLGYRSCIYKSIWYCQTGMTGNLQARVQGKRRARQPQPGVWGLVAPSGPTSYHRIWPLTLFLQPSQ